MKNNYVLEAFAVLKVFTNKTNERCNGQIPFRLEVEVECVSCAKKPRNHKPPKQSGYLVQWFLVFSLGKSYYALFVEKIKLTNNFIKVFSNYGVSLP